MLGYGSEYLHRQENLAELVDILSPPVLEEILEFVVGDDELRLFSPHAGEFKG